MKSCKPTSPFLFFLCIGKDVAERALETLVKEAAIVVSIFSFLLKFTQSLSKPIIETVYYPQSRKWINQSQKNPFVSNILFPKDQTKKLDNKTPSTPAGTP